MATPEDILEQLGTTLPKTDRKGKGVILVRQVGNLLFLSGHGCTLANGELTYKGKVGLDLTIEEGYQAARQCGIRLLATLKDHLGTLDRVEKIVKVLGFVNSCPDFCNQPEVMHGFSDLMTEVFGARGQHARSAIGAVALPANQAVEIEMIVEIRP
jgi:enamine deaminase RidA (YjgF/YER057c/UK114 family)